MFDRLFDWITSSSRCQAVYDRAIQDLYGGVVWTAFIAWEIKQHKHYLINTAIATQLLDLANSIEKVVEFCVAE